MQLTNFQTWRKGWQVLKANPNAGMTTIEYAMGSLAAAALAAVLFAVVKSQAVSSAIQDIVTGALQSIPG